ncbi:MAG: acyl carrier protein [Patulibacter sp.]
MTATDQPEVPASVSQTVREVVLELAPIAPAGPLTSDTLLINDLGFDSLLIIELVVALEQELGVAGPDDEESLHVATVGDLETQVAAILSEQHA